MRTVKCVVCDQVVVADLFNEMSEGEVAEKIGRHENRCIEGLDSRD